MDQNSRKAGIGSTLMNSKDSPRSMLADPSKSGRLAATALGRPGKEYVPSSGDHGVKRSHDHVKSTSKEPQRISSDYVKLKDDTGRKPVTSPQLKPKVNIADRNSSIENVVRSQATSEKVLHRQKDDRERDILNQSLRKTKVTGGEDPKMQHRVLKDDREREILSQGLKRTKATGGEDPKMLQRVKDRERDIPNQSLKRTQVRDQEDFKVVQRPKGENRERDVLHQSVKRTQISGSDDSRVRLENPREPIKSKSATRPDGTKASSTGHVPEKAVKKDTSSTKALPEVKPDRDNNERIKNVVRPNVTKSSTHGEDPVKKENLSSDRKRTMEVLKAEDGKDVRVQRSVTKIEPVVATSNSTSKNGRDVPKEPLRSVKMVTGTVMKAKQEKLKKKVFSLPGQRFEPPEERDALRLFYGSLHRQIPTSDMANIWLMEHGLLEADEAQKVLTLKVKSKTGFVSKASPYQTPTPSKFTNGSAGKSSKFKNEDLLDIKPVSKKLRL
ncbi:hypothetical protein M758_1G223800 [Ceratodon purpureus]|uniref:Uncharacterized protein n=1 Tax=Ceratodon purpureus TaxID=3225 RepID=A0A8T0J9S8_CERPU|nr:hypothetical protein KC19_1G196000 [Ceratodon purpureus]KAG0631050.1 hypothetical protein M758_1G223800 [Ceratodon purpureus]